jgi:hypothetical protein
MIRHFDEGEASGLARITIPDEVYVSNASVGLEGRTERVFGDAEAEVTDKNVLHLLFLLKLQVDESGRIGNGRIGSDYARRCLNRLD